MAKLNSIKLTTVYFLNHLEGPTGTPGQNEKDDKHYCFAFLKKKAIIFRKFVFCGVG